MSFTDSTSHQERIWDGTRIQLDAIGGAVAVCTLDGTIEGATAAAHGLLRSFGMAASTPPFSIAETEVWRELVSAPMGDPVVWRPASSGELGFLGCTRYHLGETHLLLVMREIPEHHRDLARRLHEQRLEATGRIMASIAHDLRTPLASIIFNIDWLTANATRIDETAARTSLADVQTACSRLKTTIDGLLDFARLGTPVDTSTSLRSTLDRAAGLMRSTFREGRHVLNITVASEAEWVRGNPLLVEQIIVNLLVNAIEAAATPITVAVHTEPVPNEPGSRLPAAVKVVIEDDGPGIPLAVRPTVFEPFFTTKTDGTGLGLTLSREAARHLGGDLLLEYSLKGARFALLLPAITDAPSKRGDQ